MKKEEVLKLLKEMFVGCGDVVIYSMDNGGGNFEWRIKRNSNLGSKMNWSKCKKILNNKGISFVEGQDGYGWVIGRGIDFSWNG